MYKVGDVLVCRKDVCQVVEIKEKHYEQLDYYVLQPVTDMSLKIEIPVNSRFIRDILTKEKVDHLFNEIPSIVMINQNDRQIETAYKSLMQSGQHLDLIKVIKTTYLRNKERIDQNKKVSDRDQEYFKLAEKYLYTELSYALSLSYEEVKNFVIKKVNI